MKKLFAFLSVVLLLSAAADAQVFKEYSTKTITAADTITFSNIRSKVVSLQATYKETSGTSAGKFYLQGTNDGLAWQHIDSSKSLSDVTTYQTVIITATATSYASYRLICSNTSSATGTLYFTILRRPDDRVPLPAPMPVAKSKYLPYYDAKAWRPRTDITAAWLRQGV
jgi:hypothetical protein